MRVLRAHKQASSKDYESIESRHRDLVMHSVQPTVKMNEYINRNVFDGFSGQVRV